MLKIKTNSGSIQLQNHLMGFNRSPLLESNNKKLLLYKGQ